MRLADSTVRRVFVHCAAPTAVLTAIGLASAARVPTTLLDFFQPGTQPNTIQVGIYSANNCSFCHGTYDPNTAPFDLWKTSMMAQAARDPIFYACLTIANQDAAESGDLCIRCHAPGAWLEGRSTPTDGSAFIEKDLQGVSCHFCHRMVDPVYEAGNPQDDPNILAALGQVPTDPHSGQYVVDPKDRRRGPLDLGTEFFYHLWRRSSYHRESLMCANCHDVSNPVYVRWSDGTYGLDPNSLDAPHPTHDKRDEFPLERTYSEWANSAFANGPVDMGGRFGGTQTAVSTCQDCHMPQYTGYAARPDFGTPQRSDIKRHDFSGANTWVLRAVRSLYDDFETGLSPQLVDEAIERNEDLLAAASDLGLTQVGANLHARVTNQTGHKLPTGYPEGRRMWINVRFFDAAEALIAERGAYDPNTAELTTGDTKVYEAKLGMDAEIAALAELPAGESFHFALNNLYTKDNRIPPLGFTNAGFDAAQAAPVAYSYTDGQNWDDTAYLIPVGARRAVVTVCYQTTSKEYIEFLRDENVTDNRGQIAYDQWVLHGKSAPVIMDQGEVLLTLPGDLDADDDVDLTDLSLLLASYGVDAGGDLDGDGDTDLTDLSLMLGWFGSLG